jgi:hypothetical protein
MNELFGEKKGQLGKLKHPIAFLFRKNQIRHLACHAARFLHDAKAFPYFKEL